MADHEVPFRVATEGDEYLRIQYTFCPESIKNATVGRTIRRDSNDPHIAFVDHTLSTGGTVPFKGTWTEKSENMTECVLLFAEDEIVCVPLSASILHLKKS
jgi:hypothetical protein